MIRGLLASIRFRLLTLVFLVTGVTEEEIGWQAMALGAFDYIVKPLDLPYLERSLWYKITMATL